MKFTKMQGLGNDYVYLDCTVGLPGNLSALAVRMSDRHFGIGADGLICICPSQRADFRMRIFNADGSEGEMCGNGIRCVGKLVYEKGLTQKKTLTIETLGGIKALELKSENGLVRTVNVDMGAPAFGASRSIQILGREYTFYPVSMGNPHAVIFTEDIKHISLSEVGPQIESHPYFPNRTNVEFAQVTGERRVRVRVWERGSGETLACGTGACAVAAAAFLSGKMGRETEVELPGGTLQVRWDEDSGHIFMTGDAVTVFEGEWPPEE